MLGLIYSYLRMSIWAFMGGLFYVLVILRYFVPMPATPTKKDNNSEKFEPPTIKILTIHHKNAFAKKTNDAPKKSYILMKKIISHLTLHEKL